MAWKAIDPQSVRAMVGGATVELTVDRWDDLSGAIACAPASQAAERVTFLAGEYTPIDEPAFEAACAGGYRI
jgi:hypothetical protein